MSSNPEQRTEENRDACLSEHLTSDISAVPPAASSSGEAGADVYSHSCQPTSSCVTEELCETHPGRSDIAEENALVEIKSTTSTVPPAEDGTDDVVNANVSTESDATTAINPSFSEPRLLPPSPKSLKCPPDPHTMDRHVADPRLMSDHASKYASPPPSPHCAPPVTLTPSLEDAGYTLPEVVPDFTPVSAAAEVGRSVSSTTIWSTMYDSHYSPPTTPTTPKRTLAQQDRAYAPGISPGSKRKRDDYTGISSIPLPDDYTDTEWPKDFGASPFQGIRSPSSSADELEPAKVPSKAVLKRSKRQPPRLSGSSKLKRDDLSMSSSYEELYPPERRVRRRVDEVQNDTAGTSSLPEISFHAGPTSALSSSDELGGSRVDSGGRYTDDLEKPSGAGATSPHHDASRTAKEYPWTTPFKSPRGNRSWHGELLSSPPGVRYPDPSKRDSYSSKDASSRKLKRSDSSIEWDNIPGLIHGSSSPSHPSSAGPSTPLGADARGTTSPVGLDDHTRSWRETLEDQGPGGAVRYPILDSDDHDPRRPIVRAVNAEAAEIPEGGAQPSEILGKRKRTPSLKDDSSLKPYPSLKKQRRREEDAEDSGSDSDSETLRSC